MMGFSYPVSVRQQLAEGKKLSNLDISDYAKTHKAIRNAKKYKNTFLISEAYYNTNESTFGAMIKQLCWNNNESDKIVENIAYIPVQVGDEYEFDLFMAKVCG